MSEGSGHAGLWTKPQYPGDAVRILHLQRGGEKGDIRIQQYSQTGCSVCVAKFLPGSYVDLPGDTPKVEPNESEHATSSFAADVIFDRYVQEAYEQGWQNDTGAE